MTKYNDVDDDRNKVGKNGDNAAFSLSMSLRGCNGDGNSSDVCGGGLTERGGGVL